MRHLFDAWLVPLVDALIAAVAQARNALLVHRDERMRTILPELLQLNDLATPNDVL